jgi:hypothetical protein
MPLIDVDALRERFDIDPEIKDTRLTPHIGAASRRLRQWVGETTYALTDAETVEDLKNAEANLAFHFAILGLNSPMSTRGIVVQAQASEGKEIRKYLAPKESAELAEYFLNLAMEIAGVYMVPEDLAAGIEVVGISEDAEASTREWNGGNSCC